MKRQFLFIGLLLFIASACKTAIKSFEKGDYNSSFALALKECKKGKCGRQNRSIIEKSLAALLEEGKGKFDQYERSFEVKDWEEGVRISLDLQDKIKESEVFIDPIFSTQMDLLLEQEMKFRQLVSDAYLEEGMDQLAYAVRYEDAESARNAYYNFQKANEYAVEPLEIDSLLDEAINYGTVSINVQAEMAFEIAYNWDIDRTFDDVESYSSRFEKITYDKPGQFDCLIDVLFDSPNISFSETRESQDYNTRVFVRNETRRDSSGRTYEEPVYENVSARVTIRRETKLVQIRADIRVQKGSNNCLYSGDTYYAEGESEIIDYVTQGDQRAIPEEYRDVRRAQHEDDDDMVEELIDDIYDRFVREYF